MKTKRILLIDTNYPINSRNQRIIDSLRLQYGEINVAIAAWKREPKDLNDNNIYLFDCPVALGSAWKKLWNLFGFKKFLEKVIQEFAPKVIIASHWDSLILASLIKKKDQILIYENLDMPSGNKKVLYILQKLESFALSKVNAISYASRFFMPFYSGLKCEHILLENKPLKSSLEFKIESQEQSDNLIVMFNGAIRYPDTMINLIKAIGNVPGIELLFYGYPVGIQGKLILDEADKYKNISYYGPYDYKDVPSLYNKADIVWAVYPSEDFNVRYAISNKFHESIAYETPGIFANGTELAKTINHYQIGFCVNGNSIESIRNLILNIRDNKTILSKKIKEIKMLKKSTSLTWEEEFKHFLSYIESL